MNTTYYSNGKLLLTSEYLVLDGAEALAIPTVFGQSLEVKSGTDTLLKWTGLDEKNEMWFEGIFQIDNAFTVLSTSDSKIANTLQLILSEAQKLNTKFLSEKSGVQVVTKLNFPRNWGLGSSSTLINNIAQWANVNAFVLLKNSFGGSGYDIACAQNNVPILFSNSQTPPVVNQIKTLNWSFSNELYFIYLNKKQDSKQSILLYNQLGAEKSEFIAKANHITRDILQSKTLEEFNALIEKHELLLSKLLQLPRIKDRLFGDFCGSIKSLGGWGGDFILATGKEAPGYFKNKGFSTIIPFKSMLK